MGWDRCPPDTRHLQLIRSLCPTGDFRETDPTAPAFPYLITAGKATAAYAELACMVTGGQLTGDWLVVTQWCNEFYLWDCGVHTQRLCQVMVRNVGARTVSSPVTQAKQAKQSNKQVMLPDMAGVCRKI